MASSFENEIEANGYETIASLAEDLVYRLPGCTDLMIRKTLQEVYRDFCRKTCALKSERTIRMERVHPCHMIPPMFSGCRVDCVTSVRIGARELDAVEYRVVDGVLHLSACMLPENEACTWVTIACVEIPKLGAESVPSAFVDRYGDALKSGVLARLQAMTGRAWSDPNMAALEMRSYENALTETRVRHHAGGQYAAGRLNFIGKNNIL